MKYNVTMFKTNVHGWKAIAAEPKIRELKKRISKLKTISDQSKSKIPPTTRIKRSAENMNDVKSEKYKLLQTKNLWKINDLEQNFNESKYKNNFRQTQRVR